MKLEAHILIHYNTLLDFSVIQSDAQYSAKVMGAL